jgi:type II secretory pathway predicted ATPase ExeA
MYLEHFGLRHRPFPSVPDSGTYYPAAGHERALERLTRALACEQGPLALTGEPGTGKTLLAHLLIERLGDAFAPTLLTGGRFRDAAALLQAILFDLGLPYEGRSEQELRLAVTDHLLKRFQDGGRTLLVVDEAHGISGEALEELRLLGNLEAAGGKALQVLFLGQPRLLDLLARPDLAALRQRLAIRANLDPLPAEEAVDYLFHQLRVAGARPEAILGDEALDLLVRGGRGIPRLLNQAAHQALLLAWEAEAQSVDLEAVHEALQQLGLADGLDEPADSLSDDPLLSITARPA